MTQIPKFEQTEQIPPEATPDTLHDAALAAWEGNIDAVRDDELAYGGQSLRLYPSDSPRDSVLIFPVMGHDSMEAGKFRMIRSKGSKTTQVVDIVTGPDGSRAARSYSDSAALPAMELAPADEAMLARMQSAISEASPSRPVGKIARVLGRSATR